MGTHPINSVIVDNTPVAKAADRAYEIARNRCSVADFAELRGTDFTGQTGGLFVRATRQCFDIDASDTTSADDGLTVIRDSAGNRHKMSTRWVLAADLTYYIATTGDDTTGNGSSGTPWRSPQKALNAILSAIDLGGHNVTIKFADGTYDNPTNIYDRFVGNGSVICDGNSASPQNVIWTSSSGLATLYVEVNTQIVVQHLELRSSTVSGLFSSVNARIGVGDGVRFGATAGSHMFAKPGVITINSTAYSIVGSASFHLRSNGGIIICQGVTGTITASVNFPSQFAECENVGQMLTNGGTSFPFGGNTVTGQRYFVRSNAAIQTGGGGANFFPGNSAGSFDTGGQYI